MTEGGSYLFPKQKEARLRRGSYLFPKQKEARLGWGSYLLSIELPSYSRICHRQPRYLSPGTSAQVPSPAANSYYSRISHRQPRYLSPYTSAQVPKPRYLAQLPIAHIPGLLVVRAFLFQDLPSSAKIPKPRYLSPIPSPEIRISRHQAQPSVPCYASVPYGSRRPSSEWFSIQNPT